MFVFQDIATGRLRLAWNKGPLTGSVGDQKRLGWTSTRREAIPEGLRLHAGWLLPEALNHISFSPDPLQGLFDRRWDRYRMEKRREQWVKAPLLSSRDKNLLASLSLKLTRIPDWCPSFHERVSSLVDKGLVFVSRRSYGTTLEDRRVYFVQAGGPGGRIKIGSSNNIRARIRIFQNDNPLELTLLGTMPGDRLVEGDIHAQLKPWRVNTSSRREWYEPSPEVLFFQEAPSFFTKWTHPLFSAPQ